MLTPDFMTDAVFSIALAALPAHFCNSVIAWAMSSSHTFANGSSGQQGFTMPEGSHYCHLSNCCTRRPCKVVESWCD